MQFIFKVGNKYPIGHPLHFQGWRDGQYVTWLPDTAIIGTQVRKHFAVIQTPHSLIDLRGTDDIKAITDKTREFDQLLRVKDLSGRLPWDAFYNEEEASFRKRDYFVDFKTLLDSKLMLPAAFDSLYDKSRDHETIYISTILDLLQIEADKPRLDSVYADRLGTISTGTYSIGNGLNYNTVELFEADIAATLTGALTGEHADEETAISTDVIFAFDSATHKFTLTAASGAEHTGGAYGGARISMADFDSIDFSDANIADVEVSKLAFDITGNGNSGLFTTNVNGILFNRLLIKGSAISVYGIMLNGTSSDNMVARNCIIYDVGNSGSDGGIRMVVSSTKTISVYNNTCIGCYNNITQDDTSGTTTGITIKNNLCQAGRAEDYKDDGAGFGTTAKNISEDATSPDAAYRSKDLHTNSVFKGYATDDFRLDSAGDATNLAIVDDGDDLSGTFTDDIQGQTRSTWYIGASEIVSAGGANLGTLFSTGF